MTVDPATLTRLTNETTELLQAMIRNQCVNDGTVESGHEYRTADLLQTELEGIGLDFQTYEVQPGRTSLIARYEGTDPNAPKLCLMGHTDVVPVTPSGWKYDPFDAVLTGDPNSLEAEVWGRGAVDMLNLTSSMAVAFRHMVKSGQRFPGDIIYFAVADEEAGGAYGARPLVDTEWDALQCDYVLTEFGGMSSKSADQHTILVTTAEKGLGAHRIKVKGTPGHGSAPLNADNALIKAAEVVRRISEYQPQPLLDELWAAKVAGLGLDEDLHRRLLSTDGLMDAISELPKGIQANAHACSHTTFSPNMISGGVKENVIPDEVTIDVDIRTLPGETSEDVMQHLRDALGDMVEHCEIEPIRNDVSTASPSGGPLWEALVDSMHVAYPEAKIIPSLVTGGTDSRFFRQRDAVCYGAGLLSNSIDDGEFFRRFHGHNERIDRHSLQLTTKLWLDVVDRLWA